MTEGTFLLSRARYVNAQDASELADEVHRAGGSGDAGGRLEGDREGIHGPGRLDRRHAQAADALGVNGEDTRGHGRARAGYRPELVGLALRRRWQALGEEEAARCRVPEHPRLGARRALEPGERD